MNRFFRRDATSERRIYYYIFLYVRVRTRLGERHADVRPGRSGEPRKTSRLTRNNHRSSKKQQQKKKNRNESKRRKKNDERPLRFGRKIVSGCFSPPSPPTSTLVASRWNPSCKHGENRDRNDGPKSNQRFPSPRCTFFNFTL